MAKMAELFEELNSIPEVETAECLKCGDEISYSTEAEFEELVAKHIHTYRWQGVLHLTKTRKGARQPNTCSNYVVRVVSPNVSGMVQFITMNTKPCFLCSVAAPAHLVVITNGNVFRACETCLAGYPDHLVETTVALP